MTRLQLDRPDEKSLRFSGVSAGVARCLFDLPDILRLRDQPGPARRLFPDPTAHDPDANADWHRLMDSDLQHLFAAAEQIVTRDLTQFDPTRGQLTFSAAHANAWLSALNQARLILGSLH